MKVNKWLCVAASVSASLFYSAEPMARCTTGRPDNKPLTIPSSALLINKDAPIGTVLATLRSSGTGGTFQVDCPNGGNVHWITPGYPWPTYGGLDTYRSNIPGIKLRFRDGFGTLPYKRSMSPGKYVFNWEGVEIDLIKHDNISSGGKIFPTGIYLQFGGSTYDISAGGPSVFFATDATVSFDTSPSCSAANTVSNVDLGNISLSDLTKTGRSSAKDFKIDLNCSGGTEGALENIYITLTDQNNIAGGTTQLSLSPSSTATGVVLELHNRFGLVTLGRDSDKPNNPGQWFDGSSDNGVYSIPLSVNYLQVAPNPTAGKINATATYTLSYQ